MFFADPSRAPSPTPTDITVHVVRPPGWTLDYNPEISPKKEIDLPADLRWIRTDKIVCSANCVCKLRGLGHTKPRSPAVEVISHKIKDGVCFLLCTLESPRTAPTYLRQCEISKEVRLEYYNYYSKNGRPKPIENFWNDERERAMRDAIFCELTAKEQAVQDEIAVYTDTAIWAKKPKKTKNGRSAPQTTAAAPIPMEDPPISQDPETTKVFANLWVVERVIGALLSPENGKLRMWFLIKWEGWHQGENSWEPAAEITKKTKVAPGGLAQRNGVDVQSPAVQDFFKKFGKPISKRPKILSPEGEQSELSREADPKIATEITEKLREENEEKKKTSGQNAKKTKRGRLTITIKKSFKRKTPTDI